MKKSELKTIRLRLELTQEEFGKKIGFRWAKNRICEMENGRKPISERTAIAARMLEKLGKE